MNQFLINHKALLFITVILFMSILCSCGSVHDKFQEKAELELKNQPLVSDEILTENDVAHLPAPVRKYLAYTGCIGKSKVQNFRLEFEADMWQKPNSSPMHSKIVQYSFFGNPARLFYLETSMYLIPARVLHLYINHEATMQVRIANLFNMVDVSGKELSKTETVTILNDMCILAPASLIDKRLEWQEMDSLKTKVAFTNGPYKVSAILYFNEIGQLINFTSEDRGALQDDGSLKIMNWSTPLRDYKEYDGRIIASYGEAIWHYPEGDFTYGKFTVKTIKYNITTFSD